MLTTDVHWIRLHALSSPTRPNQPTAKQDELPNMSQFEMIRTLTNDVHWIRLYLQKQPTK
jgi:hypothetical protein